MSNFIFPMDFNQKCYIIYGKITSYYYAYSHHSHHGIIYTNSKACFWDRKNKKNELIISKKSLINVSPGIKNVNNKSKKNCQSKSTNKNPFKFGLTYFIIGSS